MHDCNGNNLSRVVAIFIDYEEIASRSTKAKRSAPAFSICNFLKRWNPRDLSFVLWFLFETKNFESFSMLAVSSTI